MKSVDTNTNSSATRTGKATTNINPQGNPSQTGDGVKSEPLGLGRRDDIALVGIHSDPGNGGQLTATCYDGFVDRTGKKCAVRIYLGTTSAEEAEAMIPGILGTMREHWDRTVAAAANATPTAPIPAQSPGATMRQLLVALCARIQERGIIKGTFAGYASEARAFVRLAGPLADAPPGQWTLPDFQRVRDGRLAELNSATAGPNQAMRNLRFLLREIDGLPTGAINVFCAPRRVRQPGVNLMTTFSSVERKAMFEQFPLASWTEQGLFLLGANGAMHLTDVVMLRRQHLMEGLYAAYRNERVKTHNPFNFVAWQETKNWAAMRPHNIYVFPDLVFSAKELADNPSLNQVPLTAAEESARRCRAIVRARHLFQEFLAKCGISRAGLSYRSFRHTNITHWEATGVPRRIGMAVTGHTNEAIYLAHVAATEEQLSALAELTLNHYKSATGPQADFIGNDRLGK